MIWTRRSSQVFPGNRELKVAGGKVRRDVLASGQAWDDVFDAGNMEGIFLVSIFSHRESIERRNFSGPPMPLFYGTNHMGDR